MAGGGEGDDTDHSEESEDEEHVLPIQSIASPTAFKRNVSLDSESGLKRLKVNHEGEESQAGGTSMHGHVTSLIDIGRIAQYAKPRFTMFESRLMDPLSDEYGVVNNDLKFSSTVTSTTLLPRWYFHSA